MPTTGISRILTARAVGGAALVFTEAAAVSPEGRISPEDLGVWSEKHFEPFERIARFIAVRARRPASSWRMPVEKAAPIGRGRGKARFPQEVGRMAPARAERHSVQRRYAKPDELTVDQIKACA